jgi:hypothetical protein
MFCPKVILFSLFVSPTFELSTLIGFFLLNPHLGFWEDLGFGFFLMFKDSFNFLANFPHFLEGWGGIVIIFLKIIVLVVYLGSWGLMTSIIALIFLQDYHPFLLEAIKVSGLGLFPFQAHQAHPRLT